MLALIRKRTQLHFSHYLCTRALGTRPQAIPSYIRIWDPSQTYLTQPPDGRSGLSPESHNDIGNVGSLQLDFLAGIKSGSLSLATTRGNLRFAVKRLEYLLRLFASDEDDSSLRAPIWRAYTLAKATDGRLLQRLPKRAWYLLWKALCIQGPDSRRRRARLNQLNFDMHHVDESMSVARRACILEMFNTGKQEAALQEWQVYRNTEPEYLEMGAELQAMAGNLEESRDIMEELYRLYPTWDTRVMMKVFRAHTSATSAQHHREACAIYSRMRERKGGEVTIEDYDAWSVGFLEARSLSNAKQVFVDMIRDGNVDVGDSTESIHRILVRLHMLYRLSNDISSMTSIVLTAISVLPPAYHGRIFGDWMKAAVVYKAPEAAAQILDMMIQKKVIPLTYHFNMLLRVLIRSNESPHVLKAENIAWRMVDEARKSSFTTPPPSTSPADSIRADMLDGSKPLENFEGTPKADVNTFALLMQHHAKSLQWEHVDYLSRQLKALSFAPNATIMNVVVDIKIRQGAYAKAWSIYKSFTNPAPGETGVYPDGASLRMMWKSLRFALGDSTTRDDPNLPSPRELLKETIEWRALLKGRHDIDRFRKGLASDDHEAITTLILHCFSYTKDLSGGLVALYVLRDKFGILPTPKAKDILIRQMAWVDPPSESRPTSLHFHSKSNALKMTTITKLHDELLEVKLERLERENIRREDLSMEQVGDHGLDLLHQLVRLVLERDYSPRHAQAMIDEAKHEIGLPDLPMHHVYV